MSLLVLQLRKKNFPYMWEKTKGGAVPAYHWHQHHSFHSMKVLGKLGCLVPSKNSRHRYCRAKLKTGKADQVCKMQQHQFG
jgi:hypothetical protein